MAKVPDLGHERLGLEGEVQSLVAVDDTVAALGVVDPAEDLHLIDVAVVLGAPVAVGVHEVPLTGPGAIVVPVDDVVAVDGQEQVGVALALTGISVGRDGGHRVARSDVAKGAVLARHPVDGVGKDVFESHFGVVSLCGLFGRWLVVD